ncbi:MAG: type II toxin-antitoxin system VapC family toxin [Terrimicrobiaceae bacterium]
MSVVPSALSKMGFLLDTDVLSESPKPDEAVMDWLDAHDHEAYLSTISLGEIVKGIELLPAGKRKKEITAWFERLDRWSENRLLPPTGQVMREWGQLCARHQRKGRHLPVLGSLIAATALAHNLVLVTRNTGDYPDEVPLLNPWKQGG